MKKGRLEAFTDAVIAIIMTILVLELPLPHGNTFHALLQERDKIMIYLVSFLTLAIYWNNHHHMFHIIHKINGHVLWMNNLFLFFLSLFPFSTNWTGENLFSRDPQLFYGCIIFGADITYFLLVKVLIKENGHNSHIAELFGDSKKMKVTLCLNIIALFAGFILPILTMLVNIIMILLWVVPDRRVERVLKNKF
jgi:uncharacterized membrane protein